MSSHDEYSSDEEDVFDDKSNVYLGFTDVAFAEEDEVPTIEDTFIGGQPIWLHPQSEPPAKMLQCDNCQQNMALLLQAFAPIESKPYDRVIYIFACKNTQHCSRQKGSVKAIRAANKDPQRMAEIEHEQEEETQRLLSEKLQLEEKKKLQIEMTKDLFDATKPTKKDENPFGSANPFGSGNPFGSATPFDSSKESNPFAANKNGTEKQPEPIKEPTTKVPTYAEASKVNVPTVATEVKNSTKLPEYPGFFVFTEQEKFKKTTEPELEKYKHLIESAESDEPRERSMSSGSVNAQHSQIASMLNDKHFENFSSVVGHNPSQVLRYDLGGKPLLYNGKDDVAKAFSTGGIPDPAYNPSSRRQFELQLMPKAIMDLEQLAQTSVADILNGMAWGTIVVATDVEDYMPKLDEHHVGYVQEYCGVQWEESV